MITFVTTNGLKALVPIWSIIWIEELSGAELKIHMHGDYSICVRSEGIEIASEKLSQIVVAGLRNVGR